jgi:uncharacterized protein YndB with AHSA1/START domain
MATSQMTPDSDAIVTEIRIAAPRERVFQALVDSTQVLKWWGQPGIYRCMEFQSDLRVGGKWRSAGVSGQDNTFEAHGEYLEIDRPRLLAYTWFATWTGDLETTLRWELEETKEGTLVKLRHSGFASKPDAAQGYRGWPRMLGWLQALLERGETIDDRPPAAWS